MAKSPKYKVYNPHNIYMGATKEAEAAAAIVSLYGYGSTIRVGHSKQDIIWTEGEDGYAGESYDFVTSLVHQREQIRGIK